MLCQALGDAHRLLHASPQPLTWPDTSPLPRIAKSTDGLSARMWMPARSWGPGLSQGGLERVGEEEHSTKRVRLVTAGSKELLHQTVGHSSWSVGPGFKEVSSNSVVVWEPLKHPRRFGMRTKSKHWRETVSGGWNGMLWGKA